MSERINNRRRGNIFKRDVKRLPQLKTNSVIFDTLNGKKEKYSDGELKTVLGITAGRIYSFTGPTSTGKSTAAVDLAYEIIKPYANSMVYYMDFERSVELTRIQQLTGLYIDEIGDYFDIIEDVGKKELFDDEREPIHVGSIGKLVRQIYDYKMKHKDELTVIIDGEATLEPTIIIVDSIAATITDKQQDEGTSSNMTGAQRAKDLGETFNILSPLLAPANITMFLINHLHEKVTTGTPVAAELRDLRQGETMPGGKGLNYLIGTNVILRRGPRLTPDKDYKVDGSYISMVLAKSRGAETGKVRDLIFVPAKGFLWDLSLWDFLLKNKMLDGGNKAFLPNYPELRLFKGDVQEAIETNPEFLKALREFGEKALSDLIPEALTRELTDEEQASLEAKLIKESMEESSKYDEEFEEAEKEKAAKKVETK